MKFLRDYAANLTSTNPTAFFTWLQKNFGAEMRSSGEGYIVVKVFGYVYKIKLVAQFGSLDTENLLTVRIETPITDDVLGKLDDIGLRVISGKDHWRIFGVWVDETYIARIHLAYRTSSLGE